MQRPDEKEVEIVGAAIISMVTLALLLEPLTADPVTASFGLSIFNALVLIIVLVMTFYASTWRTVMLASFYTSISILATLEVTWKLLSAKELNLITLAFYYWGLAELGLSVYLSATFLKGPEPFEDPEDFFDAFSSALPVALVSLVLGALITFPKCGIDSVYASLIIAVPLGLTYFLSWMIEEED